MKKIIDAYKMDSLEVLKHFSSDSKGLNDNLVTENKKKYGQNILVEAKGKSVFTVFVEQYANLLVIVLIVAAILSLLTKGVENTFVILLVITLNAFLGTYEYFKAEKSLKSLKKLSSLETKVIRNGKEMMIPSDDIVCGDIMVIKSGDVVCADARIISSINLEADESSLTGESISSSKCSNIITNDAIISDRCNTIYRGTKITQGKGKAVVYSVGMDTEIGKLARMIQDVKKEKSPLEKDIDHFSKELAFFILIICVLVFFMSLYRNITLIDSLMFAISLAVAAIPEALQTILTIVLALSTEKMAKEKAIVKDIKAIETLGNVDVLCTDKTGTLTQNKMEVKGFYYNNKRYSASSIPEGHFKKCLLLCNNGDDVLNSKSINTDDAIMLFFKSFMDVKKYRDEHHLLFEIPFSSKRKMATTVNMVNGKRIMYTKGGSEVILNKCLYLDDHLMTREEKEKLEKIIEEYSLEGLRVLGLAYKDVSNETSYHEDELHFLGFITLCDPVKEKALEAINMCYYYHVNPVMITGDHLLTAIAIGKQVNLYHDGDLTYTGNDLVNMTDEELLKSIEKVKIFARVTPSDKIRIVSLLQKKNHSVAFLGDGVNDAPALKKADVGVAMGISGTDVSKEAADVILMDDNLETIIKAIKRGRKVYQNIQNAILFLIAGNIAGIFMVIYTSLLNLPIPFAPVHLLFINLINDSLPAIAIGIEERFNTKNELLYPRVKESPLLSKRVVKRIAIEGFLIAFCTMISYYIGLKRDAYVARTMVFVTITMARLLYSFNCRGRMSFFRIKKEGEGNNKTLIIACLFGLILVNLLLFVSSLQSIFAVAKLSSYEIILAYLFSFIPMITIQFIFTIRDLKLKKIKLTKIIKTT